MEYETKIPLAYQTSDRNSFGYSTVVERWPSILTGAIDDVHRSISELPGSLSSKIQEGKGLVSALATLKYEIQHNRKLSPIPDDGRPDVALYNAELEARGTPSWHDVEWLYAECYVYRRMAALFALSTEWKSYDIFNRQKMSTFKSSRPAVLELAARYREIITQIREGKEVADSSDPETVQEAERVLFTEMTEICLWGNATDLSLLTSLTYEDIQKLQGSQARKESEKMILVNDLPKAFATLYAAKKANKEQRRVDIVLDNAGFELFVDLLLAGYLLATGLATEVVMHPKDIPWFVSDVMPKDLASLLGAMADPKSFYEKSEEDSKSPTPLSEKEADDVKFLFDDWSQLHGDGRLILRPNAFWTHAGSFWRMPHTTPELYKDLKESELVIFKGDLNYRKLTGDGSWDASTPFTTAIGPLASTLRLLALRTCKADVVVGLPSGKDEELRGDSPARKWAWSGKWAVVQFCDGKV